MPAKAARRRRGRRDAVAAAAEHRLLGDKQRFGRKAVKMTRNGFGDETQTRQGVGGIAGAVLIGALPVAERERELGCQWLPARPATAGGPAAAVRLREKGKSDHQDCTSWKNSDIIPSVSLKGMSGWPYESRAPQANSI